jgi:hypothetical protein
VSERTIALTGCPNEECALHDEPIIVTLTADVEAFYCSSCGSPGPLLWKREEVAPHD